MRTFLWIRFTGTRGSSAIAVPDVVRTLFDVRSTQITSARTTAQQNRDVLFVTSAFSMYFSGEREILLIGSVSRPADLRSGLEDPPNGVEQELCSEDCG